MVWEDTTPLGVSVAGLWIDGSATPAEENEKVLYSMKAHHWHSSSSAIVKNWSGVDHLHCCLQGFVFAS